MLESISAGCGSKDEDQYQDEAAQRGAGDQGRGGATGSAATGAGGSDSTASVGGPSSIGGDADADTGGATSGSDASGARSGGGMAASRPRCRTQGSQVILVGDSYVNWFTHTFPDDMSQVVGQPVRNYAVGGFSMASGGLGLIPPELDQAIADDPDIVAVVMDGGGNDILIPDVMQFPRGGECKSDPDSAAIPDCQAIIKLAIDEAVGCMDKMVAAGIPNVVYFFYPRVPATWLASSPNGILDHARPLVKATCESAFRRTQGKLTCHFVDLNPLFENRPERFNENDLHENSEGSRAMAQAIGKVMSDHCIAQPESAGCCTP